MSDTVWVNITDLLWPAGCVYLTTASSGSNSPSTLFGGSWTNLGIAHTFSSGNDSYNIYAWLRTS